MVISGNNKANKSINQSNAIPATGKGNLGIKSQMST